MKKCWKLAILQKFKQKFEKSLTNFCWNFEIWAAQRIANLVDLEKPCKMTFGCYLSCRYSRDRASQSLEDKSIHYSFASLDAPRCSLCGRPALLDSRWWKDCLRQNVQTGLQLGLNYSTRDSFIPICDGIRGFEMVRSLSFQYWLYTTVSVPYAVPHCTC